MKLTPEQIRDARQKIGELLGRIPIQVAHQLKADDMNVIACQRVESFDMDSNDIWESEENKSYPRDLNCGTCNKQVVMSNAMFRMYETRPATARVEILCADCFMTKMKSDAE